MSTVQTINVKHPSSGSNNIVLDSSGNMTGAGTLSMSSSFLRNRIINGDMRIDQRNAGAAVTQTTSVVYTVDRWSCFGSAASKFTAQRNAGSVTPPSGFTNYLGVTSSSAYTVGASEFFFVQQVIEGFNTADLAWGTASAQTVTLSVWVRSSLTGTFGGTISNGATNRVYPFTYTISAANTWEFKTITVAGDTTGTWSTDNSGGVVVNFNMGAGASVSGTAGAWSGSTLRAPTGATSVVGTNGATFYLTGVQLEVGSVATPFERRQYGQELALCQRYTYVLRSNSAFSPYAVGHGVTTTNFRVMMQMPVTMRSAPTISTSGTFIWSFGNAATPAALAANTLNTVSFDNTTTGISANGGYMLTDAGSNNSSITLSAEL